MSKYEMKRMTDSQPAVRDFASAGGWDFISYVNLMLLHQSTFRGQELASTFGSVLGPQYQLYTDDLLQYVNITTAGLISDQDSPATRLDSVANYMCEYRRARANLLDLNATELCFLHSGSIGRKAKRTFISDNVSSTRDFRSGRPTTAAIMQAIQVYNPTVPFLYMRRISHDYTHPQTGAQSVNVIIEVAYDITTRRDLRQNANDRIAVLHFHVNRIFQEGADEYLVIGAVNVFHGQGVFEVPATDDFRVWYGNADANGVPLREQTNNRATIVLCPEMRRGAPNDFGPEFVPGRPLPRGTTLTSGGRLVSLTS